MEWRRRRIPDVRHPDKVEHWPDKIPDVRHPGGMSYATRRKGAVCVSKGEGATRQFLGRIPQVGESLERETGLVGCMDMEAWVSGFNGYAKGWWTACTQETPCKWDGE